MAKHPKSITLSGPFLDAVERLLRTAPPPRSAEDKLLTKVEARRKRNTPAGAKKKAEAR